MPQSFEDMKKFRKEETDKLQNRLENMGKGSQNDDDPSWWKPKVDQAGNGYAIFRFLPAPPGEDFAFVKWWGHFFRGPGGWYVEKSLMSIGQDDPVSEMNQALWAQGENSWGRKRVSGNGEKNTITQYGTKRQLHYATNIYIKESPNPDEKGKVFRFRFGPKIFAKINDLMHPIVESDLQINPFDLWEGCDFRLIIKRVAGQRNYDSSEFVKPPSQALPSDAEMERVWKECYPLATLVEPSNFKSYDELKKKLERVCGSQPGKEVDNNDEPPVRETPSFRKTETRGGGEKSGPTMEESSSDEPPWDVGNEDEDPAAYFKRLVEK